MDVNDRELRLQRIYLEALPGRLNEIQLGFDTALSSDSEENALFTLYRTVHNLAGSSATYGFELIGNKAYEMELWLEDLMADKTRSLAQDKDRFVSYMDVLKQLSQQLITKP